MLYPGDSVATVGYNLYMKMNLEEIDSYLDLTIVKANRKNELTGQCDSGPVSSLYQVLGIQDTKKYM